MISIGLSARVSCDYRMYDPDQEFASASETTSAPGKLTDSEGADRIFSAVAAANELLA
jgi:hypothetical protein